MKKKESRNIKIYKNLFFLLILIILYLYINIINKSHTKNSTFIPNKEIEKRHLNKDNNIRLNSYNIWIDNKKDFYTSKYLFLMPGKVCPIHDIKTIFFKPVYPKLPYKFIKFQEKDIYLKAIQDKNFSLTAFTQKKTEVRELILKKLGFNLDTKMNSHNLYVTPYNISKSFENEIKNFLGNNNQKINKFFNFQEYVSKSLLYINYKKFKDKYPTEFNYLLESYSYPEEKEKIIEKFNNYSLKNNNDVWMIKPKLGSLGSEISIITNFTEIKSKSFVLTKYLYNPYLIRGYKFDIRFHGLVSGLKPLKLYLYNEGFVRLASEKYNFSISAHQNKFAFLTNIFVNKQNKKKYIYPQNISNIENSNLWNLETFQIYCNKNNINYTKIYIEVVDIFIKSMMTVRKKLIEYIETLNLNCSNFYHLIGYDIILDENLKPYLLEMNRKCSMRTDNDAEKYYVYNIIADTLNILGIRPEEFNHFNKNNNTKESLKVNLEESLCELDRPRGGYKLVFPLKQNVEKYKKFFGKKIPKEDEQLWSKLIE